MCGFYGDGANGAVLEMFNVIMPTAARTWIRHENASGNLLNSKSKIWRRGNFLNLLGEWVQHNPND